jgi:hypothetical protein
MRGMGYSFFYLSGDPVSEEYLVRLCELGRDKMHVWDDFLIKHPSSSEGH